MSKSTVSGVATGIALERPGDTWANQRCGRQASLQKGAACHRDGQVNQVVEHGC